MLIDQFFYNNNMKLLCRDDTCSVYQMKNESGEGTITNYRIYPGVFVMYNDFHMSDCPPRNVEHGHVIGIHHCLEGRVESEVKCGAYVYQTPGDIMLDSFFVKHQHCSFPLNHFHGITISISVPEATESMGELLKLFSINLTQIEDIFSLSKRPLIIHGDSLPDHIFSELYRVPEQIKTEYLKIKILELLVSLKAVDVSAIEEERPYFYKTQVEKVKAIMALMTSNPDKHYTMENLSKQFDISISTLKKCFKGIYGSAIYTYIRNYRMNLAATLLTQTADSISTIAGKVGYANSSKFAEAFKNVKGTAPLEYRKVKI